MSDPLAELAALEGCGCSACTALLGAQQTFYILCTSCGCKRCPKATNHEHECTASNSPGQYGSSYGAECRSECCEVYNAITAEERAAFERLFNE